MALQNRSQPGQEKIVQFASTGATVAKVPAVYNALAWIPLNTADANVANAFFYRAVISDAPKNSGEAWSVGDLLYWDAGAGKFTKTVGSNVKCGRVLTAALSADTVSGLIDFNTFS